MYKNTKNEDHKVEESDEEARVETDIIHESFNIEQLCYFIKFSFTDNIHHKSSCQVHSADWNITSMFSPLAKCTQDSSQVVYIEQLGWNDEWYDVHNV